MSVEYVWKTPSLILAGGRPTLIEYTRVNIQTNIVGESLNALDPRFKIQIFEKPMMDVGSGKYGSYVNEKTTNDYQCVYMIFIAFNCDDHWLNPFW